MEGCVKPVGFGLGTLKAMLLSPPQTFDLPCTSVASTYEVLHLPGSPHEEVQL